jgi:CDP-diacylglycerol---glycerol-3-phosphate 3-phosphatidyltransferase
VRVSQLDHAGDRVGDTRILNIPNALTAFRVFCVPLMAWLLLADDGERGGLRDLAALVFVLASITDLLDGAIARRRDQVTTFGKIADPIADKALTGVALISLSIMADLAWWITIVILVRELGVTALRVWVIRHGVIPASRGGKAKTLAQTVAITMYLVDLPSISWWIPLSQVAMGIAVVLTLVTGLDYVRHALRLRRQPRGSESPDGMVR